MIDEMLVFDRFLSLCRSFVLEVFGDGFLNPVKKAPTPKAKTEEASPDAEPEKKKTKKELAAEKKEETDSLSPKNSQNAHEAIRPAETDGKVRVTYFLSHRIYTCHLTM
jgi:hypothetical protein